MLGKQHDGQTSSQGALLKPALTCVVVAFEQMHDGIHVPVAVVDAAAVVLGLVVLQRHSSTCI